MIFHSLQVNCIKFKPLSSWKQCYKSPFAPQPAYKEHLIHSCLKQHFRLLAGLTVLEDSGLGENTKPQDKQSLPSGHINSIP